MIIVGDYCWIILDVQLNKNKSIFSRPSSMKFLKKISMPNVVDPDCWYVVDPKEMVIHWVLEKEHLDHQDMYYRNNEVLVMVVYH